MSGPEASACNQIVWRDLSLEAIQACFAERLALWTTGQEDRATTIPNLSFFRRERRGETRVRLVAPSIVIVAQGAKQLRIGDGLYRYDTERFFISSLDVPASARVLQASPKKPCLGLALTLDLRILTELIDENRLVLPRARTSEGSVAEGTLTPTLLEPFGRLLDLLNNTSVNAVLVGLLEREIHYRLLMSDLAPHLLQLVAVESRIQRIARAIDWLKANYLRQAGIHELTAHMQTTATTLNHHFRQLTGMSPLQYLKWLRLNEARRLITEEHLDAAQAALRVGYDKPSLFHREYSRLFGKQPEHDTAL